MTSRDEFVLGRRADWNELEGLLGRGSAAALTAPQIDRLAALYRAACADLMRARAGGLGADVTGHLDALVSRGHSALYGPRAYSSAAARDLLLGRFPRALRRNARLFWVATALFVVPLVVGWWLTLGSEDFAYRVLPRSALHDAARAYAEGFAGGRGEGEDASMAGFYVQNNVGIAFRCFATGVLFGLGSVFFLFYNGLAIGTTIGFVIRSGAGANILTFVAGHAPFELTAIVIAGTAGLRMGVALVATSGRTRLGSLRACATEVGELVLGAAVLLVVAAAIEGFWSPSSAPAAVKWAFSGCAAAGVAAFLALAGRERAP